MNLVEIAQKYIDSGLAVLPCNENKLPLLKDSWLNGFYADKFSDTPGIAVACGEVSAGLEIIDIDNHFSDANELIKKFMEVSEIKEIYEKTKFVVQKTKGGGYHIIYRCEHPGKNTKLASRLNDKKTPEALFETRGDGGYFVIDPTPGYKIIKNNIYNIPKITDEQRELIINTARSFNEYQKPTLTSEYEKGERIGDIYNSKPEAVDEMKSLLLQNGWSDLGGYKWRRPDKKEGISATLGYVASNILYVFSSNAEPFEQLRAYTPFQVLALLKYNGDFNETARQLGGQKLPVRVEKKELTCDDIEIMLREAVIDTSRPLDKPPTVLSIVDEENGEYVQKRLFTLGNFSAIIGKAKAKKTYLVTMFTSAILKNTKHDKFISHIPNDKRIILYFDTEQSEYDAYNVVRRIEYMAGQNKNLKAFSLRPLNPLERCEVIEYAFKLYGDQTCFCVIDGVADLVNAINDELEATRVVTMYLRLTKEYNCHITTVIHQNKNDNFATGHIGSAILKKSETVIIVEKDPGDKKTSRVISDLTRGIDFETFNIRINEKGIPEPCQYIPPVAISGEKYFDYKDEEEKPNINYYEKNDAPF